MFGVSGISLPVIASRGCPYSCFFCAQASPFQNVRVRSIGNVVDEMEYLVDRFGVTMTGLADCMFPLNKKMGMDFCQALIDRGIHKKACWITEMRVDMAEPELLKAMKDSGIVQIAYGVESGNEQTLKRIGKKFQLEDARRAIRLTKEAGICTCAFFMLGFPGETSSSCRDTIRFAKELDTDFAKFNIAVPYPGTPFFDTWWDGEPENLEYHKFSAWFFPKNGDTLLHVPEGMTQKELLKFQHLAMAVFWIRPSKIFHHLKNRSLSLGVMWKGFKAMILSMYDSFRHSG
ncbi:MAG: radical SAM protein [Desulfatibacillum sp.]|nr:radical SAM protein [Desulfatibacillum sp.]